MLDADVFADADGVDRPAHGLDVVEHLRGRDIGRVVAEPDRQVGAQQAATTDLDSSSRFS